METDRLLSSSLSDVGRTRQENQDACGEFRNALGERLLIVADGMGGHAGGVTASRICVETVARIFESGEGLPGDRLRHGFEEANRAVYAASQADPTLSGMGTTGVALLFDRNGMVTLAWVGDSRAYQYRGGELEQLSGDHSVVADWVRLGTIDEEEAESHPRRNELSRAIGPEPSVEVDLLSFEIEPGDSYLLCSDGLCGYLSKADISAIVGFETPDEAVRLLVDMANVEYDSPDNVTVQIIAVPDDIAKFAVPDKRGTGETRELEFLNAEELNIMADDTNDLGGASSTRKKKMVLVGISVLIVAALLAGFTRHQMNIRLAQEAAEAVAEAERVAQEQALQAKTAADRAAALVAEFEAEAAREEAARLEAARLAELAREEALAREHALALKIAEAKEALARKQAALAAAMLEVEQQEAAEREKLAAEQELLRLEALALAEARAKEAAIQTARAVDAFVASWKQALGRGDFPLYKELGFRESESEFRELYGDGIAGYEIAIVEKRQWEGGFVALRVTETFDPPGAWPGFDSTKTQRDLVLRPTSNGMRFAGDRKE